MPAAAPRTPEHQGRIAAGAPPGSSHTSDPLKSRRQKPTRWIPAKPPAIVDTVVLRYFLFVDHQDLLRDLLGRPLRVPRIVFDPEEEADLPELGMSEITRSIRVQANWAEDDKRSRHLRERAARNAERLRRVHALHDAGDLQVEDMTDAERMTFARLLSSRQVGQMGLLAPLGPGEAACVAIAIAREWILASDDSDALAALEQLNPGHPYERIRRLLQRAANEGRVSRREANEIHREMIRLGFRDRTRPFPREPD